MYCIVYNVVLPWTAWDVSPFRTPAAFTATLAKPLTNTSRRQAGRKPRLGRQPETEEAFKTKHLHHILVGVLRNQMARVKSLPGFLSRLGLDASLKLKRFGWAAPTHYS